tara:strand:- start:37 stop:516 length:480 start_codon:yes stop_codon:yes gene_type:complete
MKLIPNFTNYSITRDGVVTNMKFGKTLKHFINNSGYRVIQLMSGGKGHSFTIARLLALTYIPNPDNLNTIDHKNRDRLDDRIENLRWMSQRDQCQNKKKRENTETGVTHVYKDKYGFYYQRTIDGKRTTMRSKTKVKCCFQQYIHSRSMIFSGVLYNPS